MVGGAAVVAKAVGVRRRVWQTKAELLAGGGSVHALAYQRASQDKRKTEKSVGDQERLNVREVESHGWSMGRGDSFTDNDRSSSRHARRDRPDFLRLMDTIRSGSGDVLVMWELARGQRDLAVYVDIRDLCVQVGLVYWLVGGVLYDLRDRNDRMMLGFQAVQAEFQADYIRDGVLRGMAGAAEDGRPHGKVTYGYRRIYNPRTGAFVAQEADTEPRTAELPDGAVGPVVAYSAAGVVRDIFERVSTGDPLIVIEQSLNFRGIPSPEGKAWRRGVIRKMVLNPAYLGKRVFRGQVVGDGQWPTLVSEDIFWACARLLGDPERTTTRPGRAVHLLSYIAECGECGGPLQSARASGRNTTQARTYKCLNRACASVEQALLDEYAERVVVAWLSRPDVYEALTAGQDDEQVTEARAEAQRLRVSLEEWRAQAEAGEVSPVSFARVEKARLAGIAEAEQRAAAAGIPPVLRGRLGSEALDAWAELAGNVAVKREIIRAVAQIRLFSAGKGSRDSSLTDPGRLSWRWRFGAHRS